MKHLATFFSSILIVGIFTITLNQTAEARRGCCSHHSGVAGCDSSVGRLVCRDGTYSPSCRCPISHSTNEAKEQPKHEESEKSVETKEQEVDLESNSQKN